MRVDNLTELAVGLNAIKKQAEVLLSLGKVVEIGCVESKRTRTMQQNKYLFELYRHLLDFYAETGFMIDELNKRVRFITKDLLHEYLKARFDVKTTTRMSTKDFSEFVDKIQNEWIEQSGGQYEYFMPTEDLVKQGYYGRDIQ
jgi:hypothetical protein